MEKKTQKKKTTSFISILNEQLVKHSLTAETIKQKLPCVIVLHNQLATMKPNEFSALFATNGCVLLLEETTSVRNGHWILMMWDEKENTLEYFDPYGQPPNHITRIIKQNKTNETPYLHNLLKHLSKKVCFTWNEVPLQTQSSQISTCGRWCYVRWLFRSWTLDRFQKVFGVNVTLKPDELISLLSVV
jgi:hypothetical protein